MKRKKDFIFAEDLKEFFIESLYLPMIDKNAFRALFSDFDTEVVSEIIDIYIAEHPVKFDDMLSSLEKNDLKNLRAVAHGLKGVLSQFFAAEAHQQARQLEFRSRDLISDYGSDQPENLRNSEKDELKGMIETLREFSEKVIDDLQDLKQELT